MSTCISRHGEFGSHDLDDEYTCRLCGVLDEDALRAELDRLRAELTRLAGFAEQAIPDYLAIRTEAGTACADLASVFARRLRKLAGGEL